MMKFFVLVAVALAIVAIVCVATEGTEKAQGVRKCESSLARMIYTHTKGSRWTLVFLDVVGFAAGKQTCHPLK